MQADAETREEVLLTLGEFRAAVAQKRIEGVLALMAPDADATLIGSSLGEIARGPIELRRRRIRISSTTNGASSSASAGCAIKSRSLDAASTMAVDVCPTHTPRVSRGLGTPCG